MRRIWAISLSMVLMVLLPLQSFTPSANALTFVGTLTLNTGEDKPWSAVIDSAGTFAYFGTCTSPGTVVKVRLSDFTRVGNLTLNPGEDCLASAVIDSAGTFAYFGTDTAPGIVVKVDLSNFSRVGNLTLNQYWHESSLRSAVIDSARGFAYFATMNSWGMVVRVRLSDFTYAGNLTFNPGENMIHGAVIDSYNGFAYFGTYTAPGIVVKVDLSSFSRVGNLTLNPGENNLWSAAFDPGHGFAYFGTVTEPAIVVKVDLSSFTRVGNLTLGPYEGMIHSAVIDSWNGYVYFGTYTTGTLYPRVVKVRLSDFRRVGALKLSWNYPIWSGVIDMAHGYAYFGTSFYPGTVVKVGLVSLSDLRDFDASPIPGRDLLVTGDIAINPHGSKPSGVYYQQGRDTTPLGFVSGMLYLPQPSKFDTNTAWINATSGRPLNTTAPTLIFTIGGPDINGVTHYYEHTNVMADRAPVTWSEEGSDVIWRVRNGTVVVNVTQTSTNVPPGTSDVFVIQILRDADGRLVVLMYGERYTGTWAAAWYFKYVIYPDINSYPDTYYIVRWTDATSGSGADFVPGAGDTFEILAQGV